MQIKSDAFLSQIRHIEQHTMFHILWLFLFSTFLVPSVKRQRVINHSENSSPNQLISLCSCRSLLPLNQFAPLIYTEMIHSAAHWSRSGALKQCLCSLMNWNCGKLVIVAASARPRDQEEITKCNQSLIWSRPFDFNLDQIDSFVISCQFMANICAAHRKFNLQQSNPNVERIWPNNKSAKIAFFNKCLILVQSPATRVNNEIQIVCIVHSMATASVSKVIT